MSTRVDNPHLPEPQPHGHTHNHWHHKSRNRRRDSYSAALLFPPGAPLESRVFMSQVRIPLADFAGVNMTNVSELTIELGAATDVQISDIAFTSLPIELVNIAASR